MGYISDNLMEGEEILYEGRLSGWALAKWIGPGFVMMPFIFSGQLWGAIVFAMGVGMLTAALIQMATTEMAVTTERVIAKRGWISRRTTEISLSRVEGVEVNQTINQRLLGYGHILVSGVGSHKAKIAGVANPLLFRKAFLTALEERENETRGREDGKVRAEPAEAHRRGTEDALQAKAAANGSSRSFEEELKEIVAEVNGIWVIVSKDELLKFVQRWKSKDQRALALISLNEEADVLKDLKAE